jgi:hypothetical protein
MIKPWISCLKIPKINPLHIAYQELRRMEDQVAQSEQALRRCDRRRTETAKFLKRAPELPDAKTHLEEDKLQESEQQLGLGQV